MVTAARPCVMYSRSALLARNNTQVHTTLYFVELSTDMFTDKIFQDG